MRNLALILGILLTASCSVDTSAPKVIAQAPDSDIGEAGTMPDLAAPSRGQRVWLDTPMNLYSTEVDCDAAAEELDTALPRDPLGELGSPRCLRVGRCQAF
jgi:hypothetical protein